MMTSKVKTEDKAAAGAPENKPAEAPENKDQAEKAAEGEGDPPAETPADPEAAAGADDETPNERGLTAADIAATDHSDAIEMEFLKEGSYDLVGGARIVGRKGDRCALRPDDAKAAIKSGLMAIVEAVAE
jgi:hypothetical protein